MNLADLVTIARETPLADLPKLAGGLVEALAIVQVRLVSPPSTSSGTQEPEGDRLLDASEAAPLVGLSVKQLKRRRDPFRRVIGGRTVRYSERALTAWLKRRAA